MGLKRQGDFLVSPEYEKDIANTRTVFKYKHIFCVECCALLYTFSTYGKLKVRSDENDHYPYCKIGSIAENRLGRAGRVIME